MTCRFALFLLTALAAVPATGLAQEPYNARWIWVESDGAPAKKAWFRREVRSGEPSTGAVRIIADDRFTLWVNGQKIGSGEREKLYRFNLNGIVERGPNVIAIEAENTSGKAGLFVDGEVRTQGGQYIPFDGGPEWQATAKQPGDEWIQPGFDTESWQAVVVIGPHAESPWKHVVLKESYLDRFSLAQGFELERIAEPELTGSLVAMTWGNGGRLIASRERGPILSLTDENGDGKYDKVTEYSTAVTNCQGLCMVFEDLYAVGNGPQGTGIYRLPDENNDGQADSVEHLYSYRGGMGEHGPHNIVFGPDGWLYNNLGNHAWVTAPPEPTTAVRNQYEGDLLQPRFEDARGHAAGIKVPGGTVWRFTPDAKKWYCETAGFRNEYDIAFNRKGDLFTFDSDMEWDVGMPWYRPVRVNHCIPGAEFGWRSGSAKWPEYYFDSLPGTVDIGRGSPTGVVFYNHRQFPEKYRGAFLVCDWSMGRIIAANLKQDGATYTGSWENIVTGNPLNVSDIEVDRDGSVVFCTGGRNTEGGIYRVTYPEGDQSPAKATNLEELLSLPQVQAAWAREIAAGVRKELGDLWSAAVAKEAGGDPAKTIQALTLLAQFGPEGQPSSRLLLSLAEHEDAEVRAFAVFLLGNHDGEDVKAALSAALEDEDATVQRRACEAFVRSGMEPPVESLVDLLDHEDRWLRYAARIALERVPVQNWIGKVLNSKKPWVALNGMLAIYRLGTDTLATEDALNLELALLSGQYGALSPEQKLAALRMIQLTLLTGGRAPAGEQIAARLLGEFPAGDPAVDAESARILAVLQAPGAAEKLVGALENAGSQSRQIHYAHVLAYLNEGWTTALRERLMSWYEGTQDWDGGHSMQPYIANLVGASVDRFTPAERGQIVQSWATRPYGASLVLRQSRPEQVAGFDRILKSILDENSAARTRGREELVALAIRSLGRSESPESRQHLRELYETMPDLRDPLARAMAEQPTSEDWDFLVRTLQFADGTTLQLALGGLAKLDQKPEKPEPFRAAILAGLKLEERGGAAATRLLQKWTGSDPPARERNVAANVKHYQEWYRKQFPDAQPAELPQVDPNKSKYTFEQLVNLVERGSHGDVERGRKVFAEANCIKCHRFGNEGEIVGPDLTTLRRRFQKKEIVESLLFPSQVISDQYRMVTIVTEDGLVHNGMPVPGGSNGEKVVLLLQDATRLEIPRSQIVEEVPSNVSVMPAGVLNDLSPEQIADLFAFLETSKDNEDPAQAAAGGR